MAGQVTARTETVDGVTYHLRPMTRDDLPALVRLFRVSYGREFPLSYLEAKYATEHTGVRDLGCIAYAPGNEAAAFFGVLAWPMRFGETRELAAQALDVATHPDHRRRGLFASLGQLAEDVCRARGVSFIYAFPNDNSFPGFMRSMAYTHLGDLMEYILPVRTLWLERVALRVGPLAGPYRGLVDRTSARHAAAERVLPNSLLAEGWAGTDRTPGFFAYKEFGGSRTLELGGRRVWLKVRRGVFIGDVESCTTEELERVLAAVRRFAARLGVHQIVVQSSAGTRFTELLGRTMTAVPRQHIVYKDLGSRIPAERLRFTFGDLDNF